jgi:hypothetical protein
MAKSKKKTLSKKTLKTRSKSIKSNRSKIVQAINKTKVLPKPARRVAVQAVGLLDERILNMASAQYHKVRKELARRKYNLDMEGRVAIELGERILSRAKEVRGALVDNISGKSSKRVQRSKSAREKSRE